MARQLGVVAAGCSHRQGCSLGLERLGLETCFFLERLVSVLKVERLGLDSLEKSNVSVLRVQRLGLEDITSRSRDFSLVNMHAMRVYHEQNNGSDPQKNNL